MGAALLFALTSFAAFAALGVTLRAEPEGRAETGVLFTAVLYGIVCLPVFALGYTGALYPSSLAALSLVTSALAFALSARRRGLGAHARAIGAAAKALCLLPREALGLAYRKGSTSLLGLACAMGALALSAWITYLAPSESWDGFFYHEPIIGYAIQNHGFRMVSLPPNMVVQGTNGYPRLCEAFALWFVIFTDKSLVEIGNTIAAPGLMLAAFVLARRYSRDDVALLGWSAALVLMPAVITQTRTSMIDVEVAFFLLAAVHFATRMELRTGDVVAASLAMTLLVGSKSTALVWVPPIALVAYGRLLLAGPTKAAVAMIAGGGAAITGVAALTFARNYLAFANPLWPVSYSNPRFGIDWRGLVTLAQISPDPPLKELIAKKYHHPIGGVPDIIARDYGYGVPWVVVPLALVALAVAVVTAVRARLSLRPSRETENLLLVAALGAAFVKGSPSLNIARYNVEIVAIGMASVAWLAGRMRAGKRLHEGVMSATLLFTIVPMIWTDWLFGVDTAGIAALARAPARERATMNVAAFQMPADVARARERELRAGDLVIFTAETAFPGVLWNHEMSNRVEFVDVKTADALVAEIARRKPTWVVVGAKSQARTALEMHPGGWELVGTAVAQDRTVALRRKAR